MNRINTLLLSALLTLSASAMAHEGNDHKTAGPVHMEQKAWGIAGDAKAVKRTVSIYMDDSMRFKPETIEIRQGEVIKFVIYNQGKQLHEMVIGTKPELDAHAAQMLKFPNMQHDEPYMTHIQPAGKGEIIWNFNRAGDFDFACLIAGHYQAGMVGKIKVVGDAKSAAPSVAPSVAVVSTAAPATQDMSEGEVRKVDKENKKITLKHGEIKSIDMPPMTMVFQVREPVDLETVKVGDKIRFRASNEAGKLTVTDLSVVK